MTQGDGVSESLYRLEYNESQTPSPGVIFISKIFINFIVF